MTSPLVFNPGERVLVFVPHPDDESISTGGLLQRVLESLGSVGVVFATDGDNNPWAQRAWERRLWIGARDRARFAVRRREEIHAALSALGVPPSTAKFLAFPDQGLTGLLLRGSERIVPVLAQTIIDFKASLVIGSAIADFHPDHSALGVLLALAIESLPLSQRPARALQFVVHNPNLRQIHTDQIELSLEKRHQDRKRTAIGCHKTQLFWRNTWLFNFVEPEERFINVEPHQNLAPHPIGEITRHGDTVQIALSSHNHLRAFGRRTLYLACFSHDGAIHTYGVTLTSTSKELIVLDLISGDEVSMAHLHQGVRNGFVELRASLFSDCTRVFAKIEHKFGFFDEAGWKEIRVKSL